MSVWIGKIGRFYSWASAMFATLIIVVIVFVLLANSSEAITTIGFQLFTLEWNPPDDQFGILSMLYSSIVVTLLSLSFAVPVGLLTAIYTSEILSSKFRIFVKSIIELLAGIPSIVYGLIGVASINLWIGDLFNLQTGRTILTAAVVLSIMILPTIITLCDDALQNIPTKYREASKGLGLYKYEVITKALLPIAKSDIVGAVLLAVGRALGETMAVMLLIGSIDKIPTPFYNILSPGQTITSKLGREIAESAYGSLHFSAMIFLGLFLLVIVLAITMIAQHFTKGNERLYE